jgi:hypothetical protein
MSMGCKYEFRDLGLTATKPGLLATDNRRTGLLPWLKPEVSGARGIL